MRDIFNGEGGIMPFRSIWMSASTSTTISILADAISSRLRHWREYGDGYFKTIDEASNRQRRPLYYGRLGAQAERR